ncbi:MAG: glycosyltransferase [Dongiaceae bacterium]
MRASDLIIGVFTATLFAGVWSLGNQPVEMSTWTEPLRGMSFAPYRPDANPMSGKDPTPAQIAEDLKVVTGSTRSVRTYTTAGVMAEVPRLAWANGLTVTAGAWIGPVPEENRREVAGLIDMTRRNGNITQLIVGNEAVLRGDITVPELTRYLRDVRRATPLPVSTAEPWHVWLDHPELAQEVDFLAVHILPFWEGVAIDNAVDFVLERYHELKARFPKKRIVITEVGWPSQGLTRKDAVASPTNQGLFLRRFLQAARTEGLDYFVIEAFDQPWKAEVEGGVGAYWGIFDADRHHKAALTGILVDRPDWPWLSLATLAIGFPFVIWLLRREESLRRGGQLTLAFIGQAVVTAGVWIYAGYDERYLTSMDIWVLAIIGPATLLLMGIFVTEGIELAHCLWRGGSRRRLMPPAEAAAMPLPKISVHVPCRNEPAAMMAETLRALDRLDYPDYEVLVIDNNTTDPLLWRPIEALCKELGPKFRFFHLENWPGFKAGALNFGLRETHPDATVIATIDSDYVVRPEWLKDLAGHFVDPAVALVQAPQDYRDGQDDIFKRLCFWEYAGFFHLGMKTRDEQNAIIQHGTMALIRRSALEAVGGWGEWCITEDAELGLRLFEGGYQAIYTEKSYGRGLMPDSFDAYRKQRFRWAYGAMQILKAHWRELLPFGKRKLTVAQRYQFIAGWLPWFADALQLFFVALAIVWTAGMVLLPRYIEPPLTLFLIITLSLFGFKVGKSLWLYIRRVPCKFRDCFGAALAGLALSYTVARAVWQGMFTSNLPFFRTPKCENQPALIRALMEVRVEAVLALLLIGAAILIALTRGMIEPAARIWAVLLCVQALPFVAALVMSLLNALPTTRRQDTGGLALAPAPAVQPAE